MLFSGNFVIPTSPNIYANAENWFLRRKDDKEIYLFL